MTTASASTARTPLSAEHLARYQRDGFVLVRGLIPPELMSPIKRVMLDLMGGEQAGWDVGHFQFVDPKRFRAPGGAMIPGGVQGPAQHKGPEAAHFRAVADHANLRAAMSELLGGPVTRFTDQALMKSAWINDPQGGRTYFHQDSYYWHLKPRSGCNAWIPCDRVGKDASALALKPGTHSRWALDEHESYYDEPAWCSPRTLEPFKRHRIPLDRVDDSDEVLVEMEPGDAVFFTNYTWHRSEPNYSGKHLAAYAIAYQLAGENNRLERK